MLFYLWLWGLGASTINVIKSARARTYLERYDPEFVKYMEEQSDQKKLLHNAKAIIKMLIPLYNIYHPVRLLFDRSFELASIWKSQILEKEAKKAKKAEKLAKLFPREDVKKEEAKQEAKKEINKEPVVVKQQVKKYKDQYEILSDYCDTLNNSNTEYNVIMKFYESEYKKAKIDYLEAKKENNQSKMVDAYKRMKIVSDKSVELNQIKKNGVSHKLK